MKNTKHIPVLLEESIKSLNIQEKGIYIDATFGGGGHSSLILSNLKNGMLYALDRDYESVLIGKKFKDKRFKIIHTSFSLIKKNLIKKFNLTGKVNGILIDCGISSIQIDNFSRGFSFMHNGPLDMRMDQSHGITAYNWLLKANEKEIFSVLKKYGEVHNARKISQIIYNKKKISPITTTYELSDIICSIKSNNKFHHPATKTFLAIRSFINQEQKELKNILNISMNILAPFGRLSIITFNSLEDKIVKNFMYQNSNINFELPEKIPLTKNQIKKIKPKNLKILNKIFPNKKEILKNKKSRSAILRVAEFIKQT